MHFNTITFTKETLLENLYRKEILAVIMWFKQCISTLKKNSILYYISMILISNEFVVTV